MIVIALYLTILNICLGDVLQQEINNYPSNDHENAHADDGLYELAKVDWFNFTTDRNEVMDTSPLPSNDEGIRRDGTSLFNVLHRFINLKGEIEKGVNAAKNLFDGVRNVGDELFGLFKIGAQKLGYSFTDKKR
ncbi:unnamed protein product, partial [Iphiclides podalirius]